MAQNVSQDQSTSLQTRITVSTWIRTIVIIFLPAAILFGAAGTLHWPMAWLYMGLTVVSFIVSCLLAWRVHPDLLRERGQMMDHKDTELPGYAEYTRQIRFRLIPCI